MKEIIYSLIAIFITFNASAQVANSKWKATLPLDQPMDVVFNFGNDTLDVLNAMDSSSIETMKYTLKDTTLTIQKLYGESECDTGAIGTYTCIIDGNKMWLKLVSDACDHRSQIIQNLELDKE